MNNTQQEDLLQPWHKPEVVEVEIEETLADGLSMNGLPRYPVS